VKNALEEIDIVLRTFLIEACPANRFSSARRSRVSILYAGFKFFLKSVLQLGPCGGEYLDAIVYIGIMRGRNHDPSHSPSMTDYIGHSCGREHPYTEDIRPSRAYTRSYRCFKHWTRETCITPNNQARLALGRRS
jgi:hypothetical protein